MLFSSLLGATALVSTVFAVPYLEERQPKCRNVPSSSGWPSEKEWKSLNTTVHGRLVKVVPSAAFCHALPSGSCTDAQWTSATFSANIPGGMNLNNWEQDYDSSPPSLCLRNGTTCGQGIVPLYGVLAESASDVQAGVKFASTHNLRLAVKASGHDYLGRSTAKNSFLISTHKLQDVTFTESFMVGHKNLGSAVTVGSGVPLNALYQAAKAQGKMIVGGSAGTVVAAGGYAQGGGHSAMSPTFGLAADNVLEYQVVIASGSLITVNSEYNSDLFWAMRGGGPGSWGVIISATFRTYPGFNLGFSNVFISTNSSDVMGKVAALHARRLFDLDQYRAGQYFYLFAGELAVANGATTNFLMQVLTYFPNQNATTVNTVMKPFLDGVTALGAGVTQTTAEVLANDLLTQKDDAAGDNYYLGSRLFPTKVYQKSPDAIGTLYTNLLNVGTLGIFGHLVGGGKVAENAKIDSAVNPKWRDAKTHVIVVNPFIDTFPVPTIKTIHSEFSTVQLPMMTSVVGSDAGSYINEADSLEANWQTTFFGSRAAYSKLSKIKSKYDSSDLFIVTKGVGSERWDEYGLCRI